MPRPRTTKRPAPRSRAETKLATRAALIEAGMEELALHGLDASLDAICARAALTRGAFYVHFADRDAFLLAVMNHVLGGFVGALTGKSTEVGSVERAIRMYFSAARARAPEVHAGRGLRFYHLMDACHRSRQIGDTYRTLVTKGRAQLAAGLESDQAAGRIRSDVAAQALADLMTALALGIVAMLELELPLDLARSGDAAVALFASDTAR